MLYNADSSAYAEEFVISYPNLAVQWRPYLNTNRNESTPIVAPQLAVLDYGAPRQINCTTGIGTYQVRIKFDGNGRTLESKLDTIETPSLNMTFLDNRGFFDDFIETDPKNKVNYTDSFQTRFAKAQAYAIEQAAVRPLIGNITYCKFCLLQRKCC
jgi:hypothetical protein